MTGAEAMAKCLELEGIKVVYGYPGVTICPLFNSLIETDIHEVLVRIEANAAHSASGYARISGKAGVAICTSGPGATNLITGIATAYADSIPLICITGQVAKDKLGSDVFQEADIIGAAESFVKYSYLVRDPKDIPRVFKEAFYIANSGRRGPVLIDVPFDVQQAELKNFVYPDEVNLRTYKPTVKGNTVQLKKLMKALSEAKRPVICVGGGVHLAEARDELRAFAERYNIPVVATMMGISAMPSRHPLYMGMVGNNGGSAANYAIANSDVIILAGARLADRAVSNPEKITAGKLLAHIDVDPAEIGKNAPAGLPIVGDVKAVFEELLEMDYEAHDNSEWINLLTEYRKTPAPRVVPEGAVDPVAFVRELSTHMDENSVYVADVGQNQIWSCRNVVMRGGRFLTSGGMGTMGYAIPAAIGAKQADPSLQVVAVCGDGSFQMSMMELATINQEKLDIKLVVLNNGYLGMVKEYQHFSLKDRFTMVHIPGGPRLDKLAEAYDMPYIRIDDPAEMTDKIKQFLATEGSVLMEVSIDPEDVVRAR